MKLAVVVVIAFVLVAAALLVLRGLKSGPRELTADESLVRDLAREAFGERITSEAIVDHNGGMLLTVGLRDAKYVSLQVNLSSLARKHREDGLSPAAIKASLKSMLDGA